MKKPSVFIALLLLIGSPLLAQVAVNVDGTAPDNSAMLDVKSTTKGALLPRMTMEQIMAISGPANGLQVFCTTDSKMYIFVVTVNLWKEVAYGPGTIVPLLTCGNPITDSRDGKSYNTVQIGTQCWLKENLNIGTRIDGSQNQTNNGIIEKYCYNNSEANCGIYGGLYQWNELMQYLTTPEVQGICPIGWHVSSDAEWISLITYLGGAINAGGKLKEPGTTHWQSPNTAATNETGFTSLPGGYRLWDASFIYIGYTGIWWNSTETNTSHAWDNAMLYNSSSVDRGSSDKTMGFSVRCIRDF